MFSKLAIIFISAVAIVSAIPTDPPAGSITKTTTINKCNVGTLQCCQSVQKASSAAAQKQLGLLNGALGPVTGLVGLNCNPISAVGALGTGSNCNASPVCCKKNSANGAVAIGCSPVNLNV